ncbi:uncharacterized protein LOC132745500 [Ruditapes philippinarum]|uniref:uncharacterized protein LOC132745500 n=1 Tax=Ruditapes philippinarum TaxID=129788 RepID=UPI00295C2B95|nr:uncharacterized protein LOC132745500 [Ruditapes philippinarum]
MAEYRSKWSDEDFCYMYDEMENLRNENRRLKFQREIDSLQRQIDQTSIELATSTPAMVKTENTYEGFTPSRKTTSKPRRLLPSLPVQSENYERDVKDRMITQRRRIVDLLPPETQKEQHKLDNYQTSDKSFDFKVKDARSTFMKPATYDGTCEWTNYKAHFDACATLNGWNENEKGLYLSVSLRGQALGVFGNLTTKTHNYEELVRALEDRFSPRNQTELYRVQLRDRHQKATESMSELGQDVRRLANLAYPHAPIDVRDTLAKEQFIDALVNSDMRLKIKQARPIDLNDAVRHAVELEAFYRAEKKQQGMIRSSQTDNLSKEFEELKTVVSSLKQSVDRMQRQGRYERQDNKYVKTPNSYDQRRLKHFPQNYFQHCYYNKKDKENRTLITLFISGLIVITKENMIQCEIVMKNMDIIYNS